MIAKTTIIRDEVIERGIPRDDITESVVDMAVALQWHVVYNGTEPVALATSRSAETGVGKKDVLLVVCDCKQGRAHNLHAASVLARHIFDAYNVREGETGPNGVKPSMERTDIARWLSDAIIEGLRRLHEEEAVKVGGRTAPIAAGSAAKDFAPAVIAAVIHHDKLLVARYGDGRVYLLRGGMLQNLTDESFADTAHTVPFEPDLGQLDLIGEDRIVLCTEPLYRRLQDPQIRSVLRTTPAARRAAQTLLDLATKAPTNDNIALAVADYVTGKPGVFEAAPPRAVSGPVSGPRRGTFRRLLGIAALIMLIATVGAGLVTFSGQARNLFGPNPQSATASAMPNGAMPVVFAETATAEALAAIGTTATAAPTPTETPIPTETPTPTTEPTLTPTPLGVITHTVKAGDTPIEIARAHNISLDELLRNNPGLNPTNLQVGQTLIIRLGTASPNATPTPVATGTQQPPAPTGRPTRRPPTATPLPPTNTPALPTPAPTDTPVPPPPSQQEQLPPSQPQQPPPPPTQPPCPPGATCP